MGTADTATNESGLGVDLSEHPRSRSALRTASEQEKKTRTEEGEER